MAKTSKPWHQILAPVALVVILFCVWIWKSGAMKFGCDTGGESKILNNGVIVFSCAEPRFIVSCDERTLSFFNQHYMCSSFDGTKYAVYGQYAKTQ
ncbi:hypothetical protein A3D88_01825 [Candidatus Peribacteria bacterium RIFCSPHIGHO2_02_FULL_52_16]|nr:MAG: hypothetical protein A2706_05020 [Candidatus Peribacteria bacterium RIFCSPHIGHO2_01_FULL_51_35]OGJ61127.1 MAG: hypothetical protein A3D88_01825 [Candidatus Peribacteria bacterium RIFCSPHIGHO2_02_FULL_52_16]